MKVETPTENFNEIFFQGNRETERFFYENTLVQKTHIEYQGPKSIDFSNSFSGVDIIVPLRPADELLILNGCLKSNPQIYVMASFLKMFNGREVIGFTMQYTLRHGVTKRKLGIFPVRKSINFDTDIRSVENFFDKYKSIVEEYSH